MDRRLRRLVLTASRSRLGGRVVGAVLSLAPGAVPGVRVTLPALVIMDHPVPMVAGHRLAVSREGVRDAAEQGGHADAFWMALGDWLEAADTTPAVGVTNLGERQEVGLLHVHLLPEDPSPSRAPADTFHGASLTAALDALRGAVALDGMTASVFLTRTAVGWQAAVDRARP